MAVIKIDIISDVICPWCFIGYRDLQGAISLYQKTYPGGSKDEFEITWKPYFLDQEAPKESMLIQDRMLRRMTPQMVEAAQTRLKRVGAALGIKFKFGGYIGSSRPSHVLLHTVGAERGSQMQCRVAETLFQYQFEREEDVSCLETVVRAATEAGLAEKEVREWLAGEGAGEGVREVIEEEGKRIREGGEVQGVPLYVIGGKLHVDGAVGVGEFFEKFVQVRDGQGN
ncbi:hypothetical protein AJ79_05899 [Helicocarpus griseus UAMH5409]|uniref:DSBA-like thioredoxin domain-containing protein n=1 Tax=Helicocarpus griseus UAMH5409 TaxID=1447875 RepID=A0A2B7XJA2_9EURO|nr:hypothetical protein AJ79_05899 [Helicocarpus griseus UAMH5409]